MFVHKNYCKWKFWHFFQNFWKETFCGIIFSSILWEASGEIIFNLCEIIYLLLWTLKTNTHKKIYSSLFPKKPPFSLICSTAQLTKLRKKRDILSDKLSQFKNKHIEIQPCMKTILPLQHFILDNNTCTFSPY